MTGHVVLVNIKQFNYCMDTIQLPIYRRGTKGYVFQTG